MKTKEINTHTRVNWVQINQDGTNTYLGKLAVKFLYKSHLQDILKEYHKMGIHPNECHLHIWDISDINNPYLVATQKSDMKADSYMNEDRVMIIHAETALHNAKRLTDEL